MKKAFGFLILALIVCGSLFAAAPTIEDPLPQPAVAVAAPAPQVIYVQALPAAPATAPQAATVIPPVSAEKPVAQTESIVTYIFSNVIAIVAPVLAAVVGALVINLLMVITQHFGIQINSGEVSMLKNAAQTAVAKAEAWADSHKDTPSSNAKLNYAVQAMRVIADQPTVKQYTNEELAHYAEEAVYKLFNNPAPDAAVTAAKAS